MRTQKLPGLSKASGTLTFSLFFLHYDLIYGVSEAEKRDSLNICLVNYYLVYGTSETGCGLGGKDDGVNYRLNYGTFRNLGTGSSRESPGELLLGLRYL